MRSDIIEFIFTLAALVAILDYFGIKPKNAQWGVRMPLTKNWKLVVMLTLVAISLGMNGYSTYRAFQPKIIEKPVDRVVVKTVQAGCPKPQATVTAPRSLTQNKAMGQQAANPVTSSNLVTPQRPGQIPLPSSPTPVTPVTPAESAYEKVGQALKGAQQIDTQWNQGVSEATRPLTRARMRNLGPPLSEQQIDAVAVNFVVTMNELERNIESQWQSVLPKIKAACIDATERMRRPGPQQISPNDFDGENRACAVAIQAVEKGPSPEDLQDYARSQITKPTSQPDAQNGRNAVGPRRYEPLVTYLIGLQTRIGTYKENP
jgi:hypothetical protein